MENNYQLSRIHNYVMGLMSKEEMYEMEKEALNDPFLQDAIDGYKLQQGVDVQQLSLLQQRLAKRLQSKEAEKTSRFYNWQRLTIATAAAVLFLVACSLIFFRHLQQKQQEKTTEVLLMEEEYRLDVQVLNGADAKPNAGWHSFNEELNVVLSELPGKGLLTISFDVQQGMAKDIVVLETTNPEMLALVSRFIQENIRWEGKHGKLQIQMEAKHK